MLRKKLPFSKTTVNLVNRSYNLRHSLKNYVCNPDPHVLESKLELEEQTIDTAV